MRGTDNPYRKAATGRGLLLSVVSGLVAAGLVFLSVASPLLVRDLSGAAREALLTTAQSAAVVAFLARLALGTLRPVVAARWSGARSGRRPAGGPGRARPRTTG
ncbi:DUF6332 family protein [Streptomyces thermolineatus]|uniref:DUF6332 family protein n=1 Tax=Streptomyces thermolineatus TaxID=44033 RepID=UPI00384C15D0